jgi:spermidine synthase
MTSDVSRKIAQKKKVPTSYENFISEMKDKKEILFYKEGAGGTIVVGRKDNETFLVTNGKGDSNTGGDLQTQISLGQIPMILHPSPDTVFVIGFGAGTTIGNVLTHKNLNYAEVAEISPEVVLGSLHFKHVNERPLEDKRLRVIKDDGLSALRLSPYKYDVIISQPSNPWSSGVGNLFTKEFFRDCKAKLKPKGLLAQWFNVYEMNDQNLRMVINTILDQFKYVSIWHVGKHDILVLCSNEKYNVDLDEIEKNILLLQKN